MIEFNYIPTQRKGQIITDGDTLSIIRGFFSVKNEAAKYAKKYGRKVADRLYAITPTGLFDFGLYIEIRKFLIQSNITDVTYSDEFKKRLYSGFKNVEFWDGLKHRVRDYQKETIQKALKFGQGTIVIGTGGGKSLITASLIENAFRSDPDRKMKCLIIVPGRSLVTQLRDDFLDYQVTFDFSIWTGDDPYQNTSVVICNSENLLAKFGDDPSLVNVDLLIVDEAHGISSKNKISKIISKFKTSNRFGFTGTLPKPKPDLWKVIGTFGPVIYEKNSKELRDEGYLVDVIIKMIKLNHKKVKKMEYKDELEYLYESEPRTEIIKKLAGKLQNNTLILVNHLSQGHILEDALSKLENKKVFFIKGETELAERDFIKKLMSEDNNVICIAMSKIFATGINVPNIHNLLFVAGGKAFIRTVQGIGRGLRLHPTKTKLTIIDIYDNVKYSMNHASLRKDIYDGEKIQWSEVEVDL